MLFFKQKKQQKIGQQFKAVPLLTKIEEEFFIRLCKTLPVCYIFPKVAMSALLEPEDFGDIPQKGGFDILMQTTVDFAIYDSALKLLCVVEMGNKISSSDAQAVSDSYFKGTGIKTIHCDAKIGLTPEQICKTILPLIKPGTPRAKPQTYLRTATVQGVQQADPLPVNAKGLSMAHLDALTPHKVLQKDYPHIWERICMFAPDPKHLERYLDSLTMQDRGEKRAGFPLQVLREVIDIKTENDRFLRNLGAAWSMGVVHL